MVVFEILTFVIGAAYGYLKPGKEDRKALLKKGLIIGIILALVFVGLGILGGRNLLLMGSIVGIAIFVEVIILAVFFVVGTFVGDWIEEKSKSKTT